MERIGIKLFKNKKAQFAKAMRRALASEDRAYRQIKAKQLYNEGNDVDTISYELGVSSNTVNKYLRETKHLAKDEVSNELNSIESTIRHRENTARFMSVFLYYSLYLLFYFLILPLIMELLLISSDSELNVWMFFWKNWFIGIVIIPLLYLLYTLGALRKAISCTKGLIGKVKRKSIKSNKKS